MELVSFCSMRMRCIVIEAIRLGGSNRLLTVARMVNWKMIVSLLLSKLTPRLC